jgi:hypothetical protein
VCPASGELPGSRRRFTASGVRGPSCNGDRRLEVGPAEGAIGVTLGKNNNAAGKNGV